MATIRSNQWYESQKTRDQESRELSESLLGPEKAIFIEVMCLFALRLDSVMAADYVPGPLGELALGPSKGLSGCADAVHWGPLRSHSNPRILALATNLSRGSKRPCEIDPAGHRLWDYLYDFH